MIRGRGQEYFHAGKTGAATKKRGGRTLHSPPPYFTGLNYLPEL